MGVPVAALAASADHLLGRRADLHLGESTRRRRRPEAMMRRLSVSVVSAVVVLIATVGGAFAASSPEIEPAVAAVGDEVIFFNGCFLVVDEPPSEVVVALAQGDERPDDEFAGKTLGTLVDPFTYSFVVPDVQPGDYLVFLECAPGDWRTNLSEPGGAALLTVCEGECVPPGGEIAISKVIDADGDIDTGDDQTAGAGWEFELELSDGTIENASPVTDDGRPAFWLIEFGVEGTMATVSEVLQEDFELFDVSCFKGNDPFQQGEEFVVELDGDSVTFQVDPDFPIIECFFYNAPSPTSARATIATIEAWVQIDRDGDATTDHDREFSEDSWEFAADFGAAEFVEPRHPVTKGEFNAGWVISYTTATQIVLTVPQRNGFTLLDAPCSAEYTNVPAPVPVTVQGSSASWQALMADDGTSHFRCTFVLAKTRDVGGEPASPTLPPTDTGGHTSTQTSDGWRVAFALLACILAAALVSRDLGARRTASRRR